MRGGAVGALTARAGQCAQLSPAPQQPRVASTVPCGRAAHARDRLGVFKATLQGDLMETLGLP